MVELEVLIIVPIETTIGTVYRNYLGINEYLNFIKKGIKLYNLFL